MFTLQTTLSNFIENNLQNLMPLIYEDTDIDSKLSKRREIY